MSAMHVCVQAGVPCCAVYGAMDQTARKISVGKLRTGKAAVMLVTDVAARGIDIPHVTNVLNYDFPPTPKLFVHRCGRAARAGRPGTAFSFVTQDDMPYAVDLHLFLSRPLVPVPVDGGEEAGMAEGASRCGTALLAACVQAGACLFSRQRWPGSSCRRCSTGLRHRHSRIWAMFAS